MTYREGWTVIAKAFYEHDSLLLKLDHSVPVIANEKPELITCNVGLAGKNTLALPPDNRKYFDPVPITLHEPNVLLLDLAEYALDSGGWRPVEEILRLDNYFASWSGMAATRRFRSPTLG